MIDSHDSQYSQQKAFLGYFAEHFMNVSMVPIDSRPIAVLNRQEQQSMALARRGLKMAINDCVSMSEGLRGDELAAVDAQLRAAGIVTLSALRLEYSKKLRKIAERGVIKTEVEFYLVKEVVDGNSDNADRAELLRLAAMLEAYEIAEASARDK